MNASIKTLKVSCTRAETSMNIQKTRNRCTISNNHNQLFSTPMVNMS